MNSNKLLRRIKRIKKFDYTSASKTYQEHIDYLSQMDYVTWESVKIHDEFHMIYRITPKGIDYLDTLKKESRHWGIPVIISILALIISILSLYKSNQPLDVYIHTNIENAATSVDIEHR